MEEETCFRCLETGDKVKLLDAISDNELVKVCEACVVNENIPVIRKPDTFQLKEAEKPYTVYERLSNMAGLNNEKEAAKILKEANKKLKVSEKNMMNKPFDLIENFSSIIKKEREEKGLTQEQLSKIIGESVSVIEMAEKGELPDDSYRLISKIEQFFNINLKLKREMKDEEIKNKEKQEKKAIRVLKFDKETLNNITLADLMKIKKEKEKIKKQINDEFTAAEMAWKNFRGVNKDE